MNDEQRTKRALALLAALEALTARPGDLCVSHEYRGRMTFVDRILTLDGTPPTLWKCYSGTHINPEGEDHGHYPSLADALIALGGEKG